MSEYKDEFERVEAELCEILADLIYIPMKKFIRSINKEGKTYDLGFRIAKFQGVLETKINELRVFHDKAILR